MTEIVQALPKDMTYIDIEGFKHEIEEFGVIVKKEMEQGGRILHHHVTDYNDGATMWLYVLGTPDDAKAYINALLIQAR
jgi:hypothetical protein